MSTDYRSFKRLCADALHLELTIPPRDRGLFDALTRWHREQSPYQDVASALDALRAQAVYKWLSKHVPRAVATEGDASQLIQFHRVRVVAEHVIFAAGLSLTPARADKRRKTLDSAIKRVEKGISEGTLYLPNAARAEMLQELLAESRELLAKPRSRSHKYPWLHSLARELCEQTGTASAPLLLEFATVCKLDCDERTARRYAESALKAVNANTADK